MVLLQSSAPRIAPFKACKAKANLVAPLHFKHQHVICAALHPRHAEKNTQSNLSKACRLAVAGVLASGFLWFSPSPAEADVQMVSPQMVTQMARPLAKQTVDKGKVWTLLIGGAVVLFSITLVAENNEKFFPSISRANRAFREAAKQIDEMDERQKKEDELLRMRQAQFDEEQRQLALVQQGMKDAKVKVLGAAAGAQQQQQGVPALPETALAAAAVAAPAIVPEAAAAPAIVPEAAAAAAPPTPPPSPSIPAVLHSDPAAEASSSTTASVSSAPYMVVEDVAPDMGAVAWPVSAVAAVPAAASTSAHAEAASAPVVGTNGGLGAGLSVGGDAGASSASAEEDAESVARLARLQGFVSGTMAGEKSPLEAFKAQRQ